jgi:uncharacterized protein YpuA (DUF1002 family)
VLRNKPQIRLQIASTNIPIADPQKNVIISIAARLKRALPWGQSITENDLNLVVRDVLRQSGVNGPMTDKQKEQIFQASDRLLKERMRLDIRDGYGDRGLRR